MRRFLVILVPLTVAACADVGKRPSMPGTEEVFVPRVSRASVAPAPGANMELPNDASPAPAGVGGLENAAALERFFDALTRLDAGSAHADVRIAYFGDSHTAADFGTGALRRLLQTRFGDGGRGFVSLGKPFSYYLQDGVRTAASGFEPRGGLVRADGKASRAAPPGSALPGSGKRAPAARAGAAPTARRPSRPPAEYDGRYGLVGAAVEARRRGATASVEVAAASSDMELHYLEQPGGGALDVFVDGARAARLSTRGAAMTSGFRVLHAPEAPHRLEVRAVGDGPVRVLGAAFDVPRAGIVLDALGLNGARFSTPLRWDEAHFTEQLAHRPADLLVFAYGTNESDDEGPIADYERVMIEVLRRAFRASPQAACLLVGPPDRAVRASDGWITPPRLFEIIAAQRRVASAIGCGFYDQLSAMGGPGTVAAWAEEPEPRARPDRVHLTRSGYALLGQTLAGELLRSYQAYRVEHGQDASPVAVIGPQVAAAIPLVTMRKATKKPPAAPAAELTSKARRSGSAEPHRTRDPRSSAHRGGSRRTPGTHE